MNSIAPNARKRSRIPQSTSGRIGGAVEAIRARTTPLNRPLGLTSTNQSENEQVVEQHQSQSENEQAEEQHQSQEEQDLEDHFDSPILKLSQGIYTGNGRRPRHTQRSSTWIEPAFRAPSSGGGFKRAVHDIRAMEDQERTSYDRSPVEFDDEQDHSIRELEDGDSPSYNRSPVEYNDEQHHSIRELEDSGSLSDGRSLVALDREEHHSPQATKDQKHTNLDPFTAEHDQEQDNGLQAVQDRNHDNFLVENDQEQHHSFEALQDREDLIHALSPVEHNYEQHHSPQTLQDPENLVNALSHGEHKHEQNHSLRALQDREGQPRALSPVEHDKAQNQSFPALQIQESSSLDHSPVENDQEQHHGLPGTPMQGLQSHDLSPIGYNFEQHIPPSESAMSFGSYQQAAVPDNLAHGSNTPTPAKREVLSPREEEDAPKRSSMEQSQVYSDAGREGLDYASSDASDEEPIPVAVRFQLSQNPDYVEVEGRPGVYTLHPSKIPAPQPLKLMSSAEKATLEQQRMETDDRQTSFANWTPTNLPLRKLPAPPFSVRGANSGYHDSTPTKKGPLCHGVLHSEDEETSSNEPYGHSEQADGGQQRKPAKFEDFVLRCNAALEAENHFKISESGCARTSQASDAESAAFALDMEAESLTVAVPESGSARTSYASVSKSVEFMLDVEAERSTVTAETGPSYHIDDVHEEDRHVSDDDLSLEIQDSNEPLLDNELNSPQRQDCTPSIEQARSGENIERSVSALDSSRPMSKAFLQQSVSISALKHTRRSDTTNNSSSSRLLRPLKALGIFGVRESKVEKPLGGRRISEPIEVTSPTIGRLTFGGMPGAPWIDLDSGNIAMNNRRVYGSEDPPIPCAARKQLLLQSEVPPALDTVARDDAGRAENVFTELSVRKQRSGITNGSMTVETTQSHLPRAQKPPGSDKPLPSLPAVAEQSSPRTPSARQESRHGSYRYQNSQEYNPKPQFPGQRKDPNLDEFSSSGEEQALPERPRTKPLQRDTSQSRNPTWRGVYHDDFSRTGTRGKDVEERLATKKNGIHFKNQSPSEKGPFDSATPVRHPALNRVRSEHHGDYRLPDGMSRSSSLGDLPGTRSFSIGGANMSRSARRGQPTVRPESKTKPAGTTTDGRTVDVARSPLMQHTNKTPRVPQPRTPIMQSEELMENNLWNAQVAVHPYTTVTPPLGTVISKAPSDVFGHPGTPDSMSRRRSGGYEELVTVYAQAGLLSNSGVQVSSLKNRASIKSLTDDVVFGSEAHLASMFKSVRKPDHATGTGSSGSRVRAPREEEMRIQALVGSSHQAPSPVVTKNKDEDKYSLGQDVRQAGSSKLPRDPVPKFSVRGDSKGGGMGVNLLQSRVSEPVKAISGFEIVAKNEFENKYGIARNVPQGSRDPRQEPVQKLPARGSSKGWGVMGDNPLQTRVPEPARVMYNLENIPDEDWYDDEEEIVPPKKKGVVRRPRNLDGSPILYANANRSMPSTLSYIDSKVLQDLQALHAADAAETKKMGMGEAIKKTLKPALRKSPAFGNLRGKTKGQNVSTRKAVEFEDVHLKVVLDSLSLEKEINKRFEGQRVSFRPKRRNLAAGVDAEEDNAAYVAEGERDDGTVVVDEKESATQRKGIRLKKFLSMGNLRVDYDE